MAKTPKTAFGIKISKIKPAKISHPTISRKPAKPTVVRFPVEGPGSRSTTPVKLGGAPVQPSPKPIVPPPGGSKLPVKPPIKKPELDPGSGPR